MSLNFTLFATKYYRRNSQRAVRSAQYVARSSMHVVTFSCNPSGRCANHGFNWRVDCNARVCKLCTLVKIRNQRLIAGKRCYALRATNVVFSRDKCKYRDYRLRAWYDGLEILTLKDEGVLREMVDNICALRLAEGTPFSSRLNMCT